MFEFITLATLHHQLYYKVFEKTKLNSTICRILLTLLGLYHPDAIRSQAQRAFRASSRNAHLGMAGIHQDRDDVRGDFNFQTNKKFSFVG